MTHTPVLLTKNDNIATLTLNRPKIRNAFDNLLILALTEHLQTLNQDNNIRVVILKSAGDHFSSGADLNWMRNMVNFSAHQNRNDAKQLATIMRTIHTLSKPTIVAIQGAVFGGAVGLVACADFAIATTNSKFCLSEVKLGLSPAVICPYLVQAIGTLAAKRLMLTAESFSAKQAKTLGLIYKVVSNNNLTTTIASLTKQLINNAPNAIAKTKTLLQTVSPIDETVENFTINLIASLRTSPEGQEGLAAFLEKRSPCW